MSSSSRNEFKYREEELLRLFLYNKIHGKPLPQNAATTIHEHDLYGEKNPWEIWEEFGGESNSYNGKDLFFFTKLKKKNASKARWARTIGSGSWEGEDAKIIVADANDRHKRTLGFKKRFRFEKSGTVQDGRWIMHEFSLHSSLLSDSSGNNLVLCRMRKNLRPDTPKSCKRSRKVQEITRVDAKKRKTIVLGLAAPTEYSNVIINNNNKVAMEKDICQELESHPSPSHSESGDNIEDIINNDKKAWLGKDICKVPESHLENGVKTEMVENAEGNEYEFEEEDEDLTMSWPELLAFQLRVGCWIPQHEEILMLPNTFYRDLL